MKLAVSKWGNSLGIKLPESVIAALSIKDGDVIEYKLIDTKLVLYKEKTTKEIFEEFYGNPMEEIAIEDLGNDREI